MKKYHVTYDEDDEYEVEGDEDGDAEFVEFVTRLSEKNRARSVREQIERREESRRIRELLGVDGFELSPHY